MASNDTPVAMILLVISLLVVLAVGEAKEIRDEAPPAPITIRAWPTVEEDKAPGQDYGPTRVVATMATPFVELIDGGVFRKFHPVWTTVVIRERKNHPGLVGTLYRTHDNQTYVEVPMSGIPAPLFGDPEGLVMRGDRELLEEAKKFADTWERGVLHYEGNERETDSRYTRQNPVRYISPARKTKIRSDQWGFWERSLLGEPGAPPPTMEWIRAETKRGTKVKDHGAAYYNPAHYKYLKHFDATFDSEWADLIHNPDHVIKIGGQSYNITDNFHEQ